MRGGTALRRPNDLTASAPEMDWRTGELPCARAPYTICSPDGGFTDVPRMGVFHGYSGGTACEGKG